MSKKEKYALGIDLGGTNIKFGIVSERGKLLIKESIETFSELGPEAVINQIKKGVKSLLKKNSQKLQGIGLGSPGVVNISKGTVENPPNLPGWKKIALAKILEKEFKIPVSIENDANAAAIGEMIFGAGKKYESFIMITLGTGVGGGLIINRHLFHGAFGAAGELGHMSIDYKGPKCNCGSIGCIETYVGINYLVNRVKEELKENRGSKIWQLIQNEPESLSPKTIQAAAEQGDEYAKNVINNMGVQLGAALASVSNLVDISIFIIGGGVAGFGEPLFKKIQEVAKERVLISSKKRVKVIPAKLKNNAGIKGASALVFYRP